MNVDDNLVLELTAHCRNNLAALESAKCKSILAHRRAKRTQRSFRHSVRSLISMFRLPPRTLNVLKVSPRRSNNAQLGSPSAVMNDDT